MFFPKFPAPYIHPLQLPSILKLSRQAIPSFLLPISRFQPPSFFRLPCLPRVRRQAAPVVFGISVALNTALRSTLVFPAFPAVGRQGVSCFQPLPSPVFSLRSSVFGLRASRFQLPPFPLLIQTQPLFSPPTLSTLQPPPPPAESHWSCVLSPALVPGRRESIPPGPDEPVLPSGRLLSSCPCAA